MSTVAMRLSAHAEFHALSNACFDIDPSKETNVRDEICYPN